MKIGDVVANFRESLVSVIPWAEAVGISWRRPDAYDDWDAIAGVHYRSLVEQVLKWSLPEEQRSEFLLPEYDLIAASYSGHSTLELENSGQVEGRWIFHALDTVDAPFDVVELLEISRDGTPVSSRLSRTPFEGAEFFLRLVLPGRKNEVITSIDLKL